MRLLAAVALIGLVACGDPTAPSESLSGRWTAPQVGVFLDVTFDVAEQSPSVITGLWSGRTAGCFSDPAPCRKSGSLVGSRSGDAITIRIDPAPMPCGYGYELKLTRSGNGASGMARSIDCNGTLNGYEGAVTLSR